MFQSSTLFQVAILAVGFECVQPLATNPLIGTRWRLKLDFGREPGTWMPLEWGASEGRLGVGVEVEFTDQLCVPFSSEGMVGPAHDTNVLAVVGGGPSTFVSERGTQEVTFTSGGWCVQQRHEEPGAEMLLRGWLDCGSGCAKRDVSVAPGERVFFSTGVWPDGAGRAALEAQLLGAEKDLAALDRGDAEAAAQRDAAGSGAFGGVSSFFGQVLALRDKMTGLDKRNYLREYAGALRQRLPEERGKEGIVIAPVGSLVVKRGKAFRTEYHIVGKCGVSRVADKPSETTTLEEADAESHPRAEKILSTEP